MWPLIITLTILIGFTIYAAILAWKIGREADKGLDRAISKALF